MRKSRFSESQIVGFLKELEAGVAMTELARRIGVHPNTLRDWRARFDGMSVSDVVKMRQLLEENGRLKRIVADQAIDIDALKYALSKNFDGPRSAKKR